MSLKKLVYDYYNNNSKEIFADAKLDNKVLKLIDKYSLQYEVDMINKLDIKTVNKRCKFKFKEKIGSGYSGNIYKTNDKEAIKIIKLSKRYSPGSVLSKKIMNEINISKIAGDLKVGSKIFNYSVCCDKNGECYYAITMELLKGKNLKEYLKTKPNPENILKIKKIIFEKLQLLHKNGIIHNDLHSENIFIESKDSSIENVFIIDYGKSEMINENIKSKLNEERNDINKLFGKKLDVKKNLYNYVGHYIGQKLQESKKNDVIN